MINYFSSGSHNLVLNSRHIYATLGLIESIFKNCFRNADQKWIAWGKDCNEITKRNNLYDRLLNNVSYS